MVVVVVVVVASVVVDVLVVVVDVVAVLVVGSLRPASMIEVAVAELSLESHAAATNSIVSANAQIRLRMISSLCHPCVVVGRFAKALKRGWCAVRPRAGSGLGLLGPANDATRQFVGDFAVSGDDAAGDDGCEVPVGPLHQPPGPTR